MKRIVVVNDDVVEVKIGQLAEFPDNVYLTTPYVCGRVTGNCAGRAMYLDLEYNWEIVSDSEGTAVLIAMKKK